MHTRSGHVGHALIDRRRQIIDIDDGYAEMIGIPRAQVIGRPASQFAHPNDRVMADAFLQAIWHDPGQTTHRGTIRCQQADGGMLWLNIAASRLGQGDAAVIALSARLLCHQLETESVHAYWRMARLLLEAIDGAKRAFGAALAANPACEILLIAYLTEAEANAVAAGDLAERIGTSWPLASRWIAALIDAGFAEAECAGPVDEATPIRLSSRALSLLESLFAALGSALQGPRVPA